VAKTLPENPKVLAVFLQDVSAIVPVVTITLLLIVALKNCILEFALILRYCEVIRKTCEKKKT